MRWLHPGRAAVAALLGAGLVAAVMAAPLSAQGGKPAPSLKKWIRYPAVPAALSPRAQLGKQIFFDPALSASGRMSCASCHSPDHAYAPANGLAVQLGGPDLKQAGARATPSLRYMDFTPQFTQHYYFPSSEGTEDEGPAGGFMRDGRAASLHEQAALPLLNPAEMANASRAVVAAKIRKSSYADRFRTVFGVQDDNHTVDSVGVALEAFETEDPSFHPYTSKFDAVMSGNAQFTPAELRGYALYNNPAKGNCARCHFDTPGPGGRPAQFSDYQLVALGIPRNKEIPANRDPKYYDGGICGPFRSDLSQQPDMCGLFKDPTLRNVSTRGAFFHNGYFHSLEDVLHFYGERDVKPEKWYPRQHGKVAMYDDLPPKERDNVDKTDPPFFGQKPGRAPVLSDAEIQDLLAFLKTLNDGYSAQAGGPALGH